ncbi:hypothetical protein SAY87_003107 [Trapa incisa]|uniref:Uncharacterized protein n=2 Tax=Trapa TaxID=22665 RepID=A0AAN7QTK2_TRANT|nr:hypothetical protein SAY87_003107 [Trapa incisa]KAK4779254.1 hypothetical protein SAY86_006782 [Trapa natans]
MQKDGSSFLHCKGQGTIVHKETASVLCLTTVKNEGKLEFSKILLLAKVGGIMGSKSQASKGDASCQGSCSEDELGTCYFFVTTHCHFSIWIKED